MPVARRRRRCHVSQSTNQATNQAACDMQLRRACPACSTRRASVPDDEGAWQGGGERRGGDSACHHNFQLVCSQPWCSRLVSLTSTWPHLNLSLSCCSLNSNNPPPPPYLQLLATRQCFHHLINCFVQRARAARLPACLSSCPALSWAPWYVPACQLGKI